MLRSGSVVVRLFLMDFAIDFDNQALSAADEVDDVAFEGNLAAKPEAVELFSAQSGSEFLLGRGQAVSELAGRGVEFFGRAVVAALSLRNPGCSLPYPLPPGTLWTEREGENRGASLFSYKRPTTTYKLALYTTTAFTPASRTTRLNAARSSLLIRLRMSCWASTR
ncbi:hypothetical protein BH23CHL2_BH23CHL2_27380 [soil metagenome]